MADELGRAFEAARTLSSAGRLEDVLGVAGTFAQARKKRKDRERLLALIQRKGEPAPTGEEDFAPESIEDALRMAQIRQMSQKPEMVQAAQDFRLALEADRQRAALERQERAQTFGREQQGRSQEAALTRQERAQEFSLTKPPVSAKNQQAAIEGAKGLIESIEQKYKELVPASQTGLVKGVVRKGRGFVAGVTEGATDPAIKSYEDIRRGFRPSLKETVGDSGVLTNQDVANIDRLLPAIGADPRAAEENFRAIRNIINLRESALRRQFPKLVQEGESAVPAQAQPRTPESIRAEFKAGRIGRDEAKRRLKALGL